MSSTPFCNCFRISVYLVRVYTNFCNHRNFGASCQLALQALIAFTFREELLFYKYVTSFKRKIIFLTIKYNYKNNISPKIVDFFLNKHLLLGCQQIEVGSGGNGFIRTFALALSPPINKCIFDDFILKTHLRRNYRQYFLILLSI